MTVEPELLELMPDTLTVAKLTVKDGYGKPSFGAPTSHRCRVVRKLVDVRTPEGVVSVQRTIAWLEDAPGVEPQDRVVLPDGTSPPLLSSDRYPDENGSHHERLVFE